VSELTLGSVENFAEVSSALTTIGFARTPMRRFPLTFHALRFTLLRGKAHTTPITASQADKTRGSRMAEGEKLHIAGSSD
jgi:hypothetical protein